MILAGLNPHSLTKFTAKLTQRKFTLALLENLAYWLCNCCVLLKAPNLLDAKRSTLDFCI